MELDKLAPALVALQADLKPVAKSATNPFYKKSYAPLPEVMESVQPLMAKHKLAISQFMGQLDGQSALTTMLIHESGQFLQSTTPLLLVKDDPQSQGSAVTYARRYGVMSALGLVADEDDDGHKATTAYNAPDAKIQASSNKPMSEAQAKLIRTLASKQGTPDEVIDARLAQITTSAEASESIARLKGE